MNKKEFETILSGLLAEERPKNKEAKKLLSKIHMAHLHENHPRQGKATQDLRKLCDKFIKMIESSDKKVRYAGIRGLCAIHISEVFDEKIHKMVELFFKTIVDDYGKVRYVAAETFGLIRPTKNSKKQFTESMYAQLYLDMIELLDNEPDAKKKKSIEQALDRLYCPHIEEILKKMDYSPVP